MLTCAAAAPAAELTYAIEGIADPLKANVLSYVDALQIGRQELRTEKDYAEHIAISEKRARAALRPYGYYDPVVKGRIRKSGDDALLVTLDIQVGPPIIIDVLQIDNTKRTHLK
jgi:hypothetical protein